MRRPQPPAGSAAFQCEAQLAIEAPRFLNVLPAVPRWIVFLCVLFAAAAVVVPAMPSSDD